MRSGPSCIVLCIVEAYDRPATFRGARRVLRPPIDPADLVRMAAWSEPRLASLRAWNLLRPLSSSVLTIVGYSRRRGLMEGSSSRRSLPASTPKVVWSSALARPP